MVIRLTEADFDEAGHDILIAQVIHRIDLNQWSAILTLGHTIV